jgi:hypothetical protein
MATGLEGETLRRMTYRISGGNCQGERSKEVGICVCACVRDNANTQRQEAGGSNVQEHHALLEHVLLPNGSNPNNHIAFSRNNYSRHGRYF